MMRLGRVWGALFLILVLIAVAGCGQPTKSPEPKKTTTPVTTPSTTPSTTPTPTKSIAAKMAPGPIGGMLYLSEMVAEGLGSFKEQGIDLTTLSTPGGNEATKALMSGEADFAMIAIDNALKNIAQGADLVIVGYLTKDPGLVMIVQSDLKGKVTSVKDLKGQKVGVSSLGGGTQSAVLTLMKQAGMQESDIEFIAAKDQLVKMWESKQIAAAMHVDPQISELTNKGSAWVLYDLRKPEDTMKIYGTEYPLGCLVTRGELIQKQPEMVQKVVSAILSANKYIQSHSAAEITAKIPDQYKANVNGYEKMVTENLPGLALTLTVKQDSVDTVIRELREKKTIPADAKLDLAKIVNLTFVEKSPK